MPKSTPTTSRQFQSYDPSGDDHFRPAFDPVRQLAGFSEGKESYRGGRVTFKLDSHSPSELNQLRKRLLSELEQVRNVRRQIESGNYGSRSTQVAVTRPPPPKLIPSGQVVDLTKGNGKKSKSSGAKRSDSVSTGKDLTPKRPAAELPAVASTMRRCGQILSKLMKHKSGWMFNTPVDAAQLGLHDYHQIIKHPMDLGTIKKRLDGNGYHSPVDFAEDVRLTFKNALTYNPVEIDVNRMAAYLLDQFEEMFDPVLKKFERERRKAAMEEVKPIMQNPVACVKESSTKKRIDTMPQLVEDKPEAKMATPAAAAPVVRMGKLPKPKARDLNKRKMTLEEKTELGHNLQELPGEKMDQVVQIVRKRNGHLAQGPQDEEYELELDIDLLDTETLWELERFVSYHRKAARKMMRQEFVQNQAPNVNIEESPRSEVEAAQKFKRGDFTGGDEDEDIDDEVPAVKYPAQNIRKEDFPCGEEDVDIDDEDPAVKYQTQNIRKGDFGSGEEDVDIDDEVPAVKYPTQNIRKGDFRGGEEDVDIDDEVPAVNYPTQNIRKGEVAGGEEDVDIDDEVPVVNYPPVEIEKDEANGAASLRSSSSSSGSSSSGSDSRSSSGTDSEADSVQSPFVGPSS